MKIHKIQPQQTFRGKAEILQKQAQYIKALDDVRTAKTQFAKEVNQNIALIYWKQLCQLVQEYDFMMMFKK